MEQQNKPETRKPSSRQSRAARNVNFFFLGFSASTTLVKLSSLFRQRNLNASQASGLFEFVSWKRPRLRCRFFREMWNKITRKQPKMTMTQTGTSAHRFLVRKQCCVCKMTELEPQNSQVTKLNSLRCGACKILLWRLSQLEMEHDVAIISIRHFPFSHQRKK